MLAVQPCPVSIPVSSDMSNVFFLGKTSCALANFSGQKENALHINKRIIIYLKRLERFEEQPLSKTFTIAIAIF